MAILSETAKSTAQNAVYDTLKVAVGWAFGRFVEPVLTGQAKAMNVPGATAWGIVASVVIVFLGVWAWDSWQARRALPLRRVRLLEHYAAHLQWYRDFVTREETTKEYLEKVARWLQETRGELLNLSPEVFTTDTADAFRKPELLSVLKARKQVEGMTEQPLREQLLAHIEHLLYAVSSKWLKHGGVIHGEQ